MALWVWENTRRFITMRNEAILDVWVVLGQIKRPPKWSVAREFSNLSSLTTEKCAFIARTRVHAVDRAGSYYSRSEYRMQWIQPHECLMRPHETLKRLMRPHEWLMSASWGLMSASWVPHETNGHVLPTYLEVGRDYNLGASQRLYRCALPKEST